MLPNRCTQRATDGAFGKTCLREEYGNAAQPDACGLQTITGASVLPQRAVIPEMPLACSAHKLINKDPSSLHSYAILIYAK